MTVEAAFQSVAGALAVEKPAGAYLVTGNLRGSCQELAERILRALFCTAEAAKRPCGACEACRLVATRKHPDVLWVFPEKKSRVISAPAMRETILPRATSTSFLGGWKALVLAGAECLHPAAANAFLKTLEEPPPRTLFLLLCADLQNLLPTIVSRCQRIDLADSSELDEPWRGKLLDILSDPHHVNVMDRLIISGLLADFLEALRAHAESCVEEEDAAQVEEGVDEDKNVYLARVEARYREFRHDAVQLMLRWYRDLFVLAAGGSEETLYFPEQAETLRARAANLPLYLAARNLTVVEEMARQFALNLKERNVLDCFIDRLAHG